MNRSRSFYTLFLASLAAELVLTSPAFAADPPSRAIFGVPPGIATKLQDGFVVWSISLLICIAFAYIVSFVIQASLAPKPEVDVIVSYTDKVGKIHGADNYAVVRTLIKGEPGLADVLILGYGNHIIRLFNANTGKLIRDIQLKDPISNVSKMAASSKYIAFTYGIEPGLHIIPLDELINNPKDKHYRERRIPTDSIGIETALCFNAKGDVLAVGNSEGLVKLFSFANGAPDKPSKTLYPDTQMLKESSPGAIASIAIHPTENHIVALSGGSGDTELGVIWNAMTNERTPSPLAGTLAEATRSPI